MNKIIEKSRSKELVKRDWKEWGYSILYMALVFYTTNTEAINSIIVNYASEEVAQGILLWLGYLVKKFFKDYTK